MGRAGKVEGGLGEKEKGLELFTFTSLLNPPAHLSQQESKKQNLICRRICLTSYQLKAKINGQAVEGYS